MNLDPTIQAELEAGVSASRLAQLLELSSSTLKTYEKDGLLNALALEGKKLFGLNAYQAGLEIKRLRAEGQSLKEIANQRMGKQQPSSGPTDLAGPNTSTTQTKAAQPTAEELKARIELLREQLHAEKTRLELLATRVGSKQLQRRNELALTKRELEAIQTLRESNVRRALELTRRAEVLKAQMQYRMAKPGVIRLNTPQAPRKKR